MTKLQFDPNNRRAPVHTLDWATYVPDRTTKNKFVVHNRRGDALNAIIAALDMGNDAILYRWQEPKVRIEGDVTDQGTWVEHVRFEDFKLPDDCENCGKSLLRTLSGGRDGRGINYNRGNPTWTDTSTNPRLITVCDECSMIKSRKGRLP